MPAEIPERIGAYQILRVIGRGGMGVLYHARDTTRHREVALKVMSADSLEDDDARARFHHEARLAARLQHRNIVKVFEFGEDGDVPFIAMEFLRGTSLADRLASGEAMPLETKLDIVIQVCEGLQCLHDEGIVHRDVKPANIWLLEDGGVKLLDLGIAKHAGVNLTQYGNVVGSAAYMSPEQLSGLTVDGRADIFSAGVVLFELLSGQKPFQASSITAVTMKILHEPTPDIRALVPAVSPDLAQAVDTALRKHPGERYAEADAFALDLRLARDANDSVSLMSATTADTAQGVDLRLDATMVTAAGALPSTPVVDPDPLLRHASDVPLHAAPVVPRRSPLAAGRRRLAWLVAGIGVVALALVVVALRRYAAAEEYRLDVTSTPAGAEISVNGAPLGRRTPAVVTMSARPERIGLTLDGYEPIASAIAPTTDARMTFSYRLRRLLQVHSQPSGARIVVDGRDTGRVTPAAVPVDEPYPTAVELHLEGHQSVREPITRATIDTGTLTMTLSAVRAPNRSAEQPAADPQSSLVAVTLSGPYRFGVTGCGTTSPASDAHTLTVAAPCTLRLRAPEYFLDVMRNVTSVAGGRMELAAPPVASVQLRSRHEDCTLLINGTAVGSPPVDLEIASGSYSATLQCPDGQTLQTRTFELEAGKSIRRIDDYLR